MTTTSQPVRQDRQAPARRSAQAGAAVRTGRKSRVAAAQRRGVCTRVYTTTQPSLRRLARVRFANSKEVTVDVAGDLRQDAIVTVRDGRVEETA
jgi:small subunit ribosomal protein S12